jgi:hypothetical protein
VGRRSPSGERKVRNEAQSDTPTHVPCIPAAGLPDKPVNENWEAALARLADTRTQLDGLPSHEFEPDLETLDSLIQSLNVSTP